MTLKPKLPTILPVIVGTAGHVDHGKSALVSLLTGCQMDRHPEAKARGLTIDLGFAPCLLPGNRMVGIVDVPGHEDFIRNMVAGASSIDVLMLIVAADDGVMPQTREHLRIVRLLRTPRVMVVVTKIDLVDKEMRELVQEDVESFLAENGFPDAPVLLASNTTFEGLNEVRETLQRLVEEVQHKEDLRAFRMFVERIFSVKGYGTVVTGIPFSGKAAVGDAVELQPAGSRHGIRAVQTYKHDLPAAQAHACAAINVRDLDANAVLRGMSLSAPGIYQSTESATVFIRNESRDLVLKRNRTVKFHCGTGVVLAKARLIDADSLLPGAEGYMQVAFEAPVVIAAGDRYIIRSLNPITTLGGGVVLSARSARVRRTSPYLLPRLRKARAEEWFLSEMLAGPEAMLPETEVLRLTQCQGDSARQMLADAVEEDKLFELGGSFYLVTDRMDEVLDVTVKILASYHKSHSFAWGIDPANICGKLGIAPAAFKGLGKVLSRSGKVVVRHGRLALSDFEPALSAKQIRWREAILKQVIDGGIVAPAKGNLSKDLEIPASEMRMLTKLLVEEGVVVVTGSNLIDSAVVEECREKCVELFTENGIIELSAFRTVTGASRNLAVTLLEHYDSEGFTRRVDEGRIVVQRTDCD